MCVCIILPVDKDTCSVSVTRWLWSLLSIMSCVFTYDVFLLPYPLTLINEVLFSKPTDSSVCHFLCVVKDIFFNVFVFIWDGLLLDIHYVVDICDGWMQALTTTQQIVYHMGNMYYFLMVSDKYKFIIFCVIFL